MEIYRQDESIVVVHKNAINLGSKSVEAHILFAILEKLEEIRTGIIDVESAVNPR